MSSASLHVGTSGWVYTHWRGTFYPEGVPQRLWLETYAERFDTVEVNASFYRNPTPEMVEAWAERTPSDFRFALKMWRGVTHYRRLKDATRLLERFFGSASRLPVRERGPLLIQLPPFLEKDIARLEGFIDDLKETTRPDRWKLAFEFRDDTWYDEDTYDLLDDKRAAIVLHDMLSSGPNDRENDSSFIYFRRHGPGGDMSKGYSERQLDADAERINDWLEEGRTVYAYYNNDIQSDAPRDAERLREGVQA